MGWFDRLPWRKAKAGSRWAEMLNGYTPIFSQFGQDIYASDVVQQALSCIVSEMLKLNPTHVRTNGRDVSPVVDGRVQTVLDHPNDIMTKSEFIEKITWTLLFNENSFIIPSYYWWDDEKTGTRKRMLTGLYPIVPHFVEFVQDPQGTLGITFKFSNNYETTLPYAEVIHWKHNFSVNEYMGGNEMGQRDNSALLKTLDLNNTLLQGVSAAMKSSFAINGVVKYSTMLDDGSTEVALKELEKKLKASESGFLPLDLKAEFIPIKKEIKLVDADTLKFIDEKILRNWGISVPILTGDYTVEQYNAFYQKVLEPLIIQLGQAFTRAIFTPRERAFGNEIRFYPKDLIFMTVDQTLEMIKEMGARGSLYENEARVFLGLRPLPELEGIRMQSLNYISADIADQYQLQMATGAKREETENDT